MSNSGNYWKNPLENIQGDGAELEDLVMGCQAVPEGVPSYDEEEGEEDYAETSSFDVPALTTVAKVNTSFNSDGTLRSLVRAPKSAFVHNVIYLDGKKFDFSGREYLMPIYNRNDPRILLKTARQVEKSTFLANNLTINSVVRPYNKALYVSPSHTQTRQFSSEKLKPAIERSPLIWRYLQDNNVSNQVFEKGFTNGSFIFLRSAFRSADRARGISARELCLDEIQDLLTSDIPVIMECTSHFSDANVYMAGTPKSFDNPIETYWKESTQNEWLVPCDCGDWNFLDETSIAPTEMYESGKLPPGPVCSKCMRPLNVKKGKWMSLAPNKMIVGYRIPQLMVPWIICSMDQWRKLLWKRDQYPYGQFANEVLGLSYDAASKPITRAAVIKICGDYDLWDPDNITTTIIAESRKRVLIGGIDWGEGMDGSEKGPTGKLRNASYTVFSVGYYENYKLFKYILIKKYTGKETDPEYIVGDVCRIVTSLGIKVLGVDWGHGWGPNNSLVRRLGFKRVMQFQYVPKLKVRLKWDPKGMRYHIHRNLLMSEHFFDMKNHFISFPRWKQMEPYAKDILSIYTEYNEYLRDMRYDHRPSDPDDFFHSSLLCKTAADLFLGKNRSHTKI